MMEKGHSSAQRRCIVFRIVRCCSGLRPCCSCGLFSTSMVLLLLLCRENAAHERRRQTGEYARSRLSCCDESSASHSCGAVGCTATYTKLMRCTKINHDGGFVSNSNSRDATYMLAVVCRWLTCERVSPGHQNIGTTGLLEPEQPLWSCAVVCPLTLRRANVIISSWGNMANRVLFLLFFEKPPNTTVSIPGSLTQVEPTDRTSPPKHRVTISPTQPLLPPTPLPLFLRQKQSEGGPSGPGGDSNPLAPPPPYREEHTPGGTRFKDLLARANGQGAPPPPASPSAKPRRVLPPEGAPDYDDDNQWEEETIGSPDVPDPPLRQNMPGLDLGPELDYGGGGEAGASGSGGSRFSRMMNQARQNDDRQEAGMAPRASPRSPQEVAKRAAAAQAPVSKEEKERAIKAAVERQQKMMAKARGIDLDDPALEGAELARRKALSRAQAEAQ